MLSKVGIEGACEICGRPPGGPKLCCARVGGSGGCCCETGVMVDKVVREDDTDDTGDMETSLLISSMSAMLMVGRLSWSDDLDRSAAMLVIEAAAGAWGLNTKGPEDPTTPQSPPALLGPSTSAEAMFSAIMARISGVLGVWVRPVPSFPG